MNIVDISRTQQVSPFLPTQRTTSAQLIAALKFANDQIKTEGQSAIALI